jgi:general secretion pathway protein F
MPVYEYEAYDEKGKTRSGVLDADTPKEARIQLRAQRIHVTRIVPIETGKQKKERSALLLWLPKFKASRRRDEVSTITRQLSVLLKAGIPMAQSLTALIDQAASRELETILRDVREKVSQGAGLAEALSHHPDYFSQLFVNMVKAGEASGTLDEVLGRLADYSQKQDKLRNRVKAALTYPVVMVIFGSIVVFVLVTFVVPRILQVIQRGPSAKGTADLPMPTRVLMTVSTAVGSWWWLIILLALTGIVLFRLSLRNKDFRFRWDSFTLRVPVLGDLLKKSAVSRFAVTFSTLLKSGIPVLEALVIVRNIVDNSVMARTIDQVRANITEGTDIATPLKKSGVFPPVVGYMISIGEQSGQLEEILERIAEAYDDEIEISAQKITSMIEPVLIICLAMAVGFIVIAILLPIMEISTSFKR